MLAIGAALMLTFWITGRSASAGSLSRTMSSFSRTSCAATSTSMPTLNSSATWLTFSRLEASMCLRPSMPETASSMCLLMSFSISSGEAPIHVVTTVTLGMSTFGMSSRDIVR